MQLKNKPPVKYGLLDKRLFTSKSPLTKTAYSKDLTSCYTFVLRLEFRMS